MANTTCGLSFYTHGRREGANFDSVVKLAAFDGGFNLLDIKILSVRDIPDPTWH